MLSNSETNAPANGANPPAFPVVTNDGGKLFVSSENVAQVFKKEHFHVLRDIDKIISETDDSRKSNFGFTYEIRHIGNTKRRTKVAHLTRDGLMFLVMGYTGEKANAIKWAYIDEFNRMEAELTGKCYHVPTEVVDIQDDAFFELCELLYKLKHLHPKRRAGLIYALRDAQMFFNRNKYRSKLSESLENARLDAFKQLCSYIFDESARSHSQRVAVTKALKKAQVFLSSLNG